MSKKSPTIERYLAYVRYELNYSEHSVKAYDSDLRQFADFLAGSSDGEARFCDVDSTDVRTWLAQRSEAGDSARTLRRKLQTLRGFYKHLMREGAVADSPAADLVLAKQPRNLPTYVRSDVLDTLLDGEVDTSDVTAVRNRLMVMMLYSTGLRRDELIGLRDHDVDTAQGQLRVLGKRNKERIIPFGTELAACITHYRQLRDQAGCRGDRFFTRKGGQPLYPSLVYTVVHDALTQAGVIGKSSPHVLRHSFATAMLNGGAELTSVKELLGHESVATTQIYTHVTLSDLKNNYKHAHPRALKKGG